MKTDDEILNEVLKKDTLNGLKENLILAVWDYNEDEDIIEKLKKEQNHLLKILEEDRKADGRNSYWATHSLIKTNNRITKLCLIAKKQGGEEAIALADERAKAEYEKQLVEKDETIKALDNELVRVRKLWENQSFVDTDNAEYHNLLIERDSLAESGNILA